MHNHSYENEFNLHVNEISFSYERMSTKTRFEKEAKGNSEMAYCSYNKDLKTPTLLQVRKQYSLFVLELTTCDNVLAYQHPNYSQGLLVPKIQPLVQRRHLGITWGANLVLRSHSVLGSKLPGDE